MLAVVDRRSFGQWVDGTRATVAIWSWVPISLTMAPGAPGLAVGAASSSCPEVWIAAALGVAYAVGFCMPIMHCLKIGPPGRLVTINNLAMVCGVPYDVMYLRPTGMPGWRVIVGAIGISARWCSSAWAAASCSLMGRPCYRAWLPMVLVKVFSGLSFVTQTWLRAGCSPAHGFASGDRSFTSRCCCCPCAAGAGAVAAVRERPGITIAR